MKQLFSKLIILSCFSWCNVLAGANDLAIRIEKFNINSSFDEEVLTRGGKFFASRCMSCHSLKFFTHNEIGKKTKVVPENMPQLDPASWGGHPPPDLSLVAKYRGIDWLYTYLLSFYQDPASSNGSNNLLMPSTSMPNPYIDLEGEKVLAINQQILKEFALLDADAKPPWYRVLKLTKAGDITHAEFNDDLESLVLFLEYVSEPNKQARLNLAPWVLGFLFLFFIVLYLLKKEYWRDIK